MMLTAITPPVGNLAHLAEVIVCPACRGDLHLHDGALFCGACGWRSAVRDAIPDLALFDGLPGFAVETGEGQTYQHKYTEAAASAAYNGQFIRNRHKQARTRRELDILRALLGRIGRVERVLNLPSGGGRLSRPLSSMARLLVEADISIAQTRHARTYGSYDPSGTTAFASASGFHLPFGDGAFDITVCARLLHHFSAPSDHRRLVSELCRVTRRWVILSFNDQYSVKAILRRLRGETTPMTLTRQSVRDLASEAGFGWRESMTVSPLGSRHTYALLERRAAFGSCDRALAVLGPGHGHLRISDCVSGRLTIS